MRAIFFSRPLIPKYGRLRMTKRERARLRPQALGCALHRHQRNLHLRVAVFVCVVFRKFSSPDGRGTEKRYTLLGIPESLDCDNAYNQQKSISIASENCMFGHYVHIVSSLCCFGNKSLVMQQNTVLARAWPS